MVYIRIEFCEGGGSRLIEFLPGQFVFDGKTKSSSFANASYAYIQYYICICIRVLYNNLCRYVYNVCERRRADRKFKTGREHRGDKKSKNLRIKLCIVTV